MTIGYSRKLSDATDALCDKRVLIVEDNAALAYDLHDIVEDTGARPIGPALDIQAAMHLIITSQVDCALLDVNIGDDLIWPVARQLQKNRVPFSFISAKCSQRELPSDLSSHICLSKPAKTVEVVSTLCNLVTD